MDDDRRKRDELGSAPTTPAPVGRQTARGIASPLAAGSQRAADSTLDMPADEVTTPSEPGPGAAIGRFVVRSRLGAGGMGVVYAGEDVDLKRPVAIKLVRGASEHPAYRDRLLREAQAMARLEHPNVVRVYEVGTSGGRTFVAMELVEGETLSHWLLEPRLWVDVLAMFQQAGRGLAAAHRAGLVHRDFKPDNVLVDRSGRPRVADFGLARIDAQPGSALTRTGAVMGTPGYMAPEQQFGAPDVDARADQYSFCVALREALGGRPVDEARWRTIPEPVRAAISRGLAYDPDERFASMDDLLAALRAAMQPVAHAPAAAPEPARAGPRQARWPIAIAAIAVLGIAAALVAYVSTHRGEVDAARSEPATTPVRVPDQAVRVPDEAVRAPDEAVRVPDQATRVPEIAIAPRDAGLATKRAPDAGAAIAAAGSASTALGSAQAIVGGSAPNGLHVVAPHTKGWPQAKPGAPGHIEIVRAAIRDLGYDGVDVGAFDRAPDDTKRKLDAEIAAATGSAVQIAKVKLGMLERRRGNCKAAQELWDDPKNLLTANGTELEQAWLGREYLGSALCFLAAGDGDNAYIVAMKAWLHTNRDQANVVMAFSQYERRMMDEALALLLTAQRSKDPRVQAALEKWFGGLGLSIE